MKKQPWKVYAFWILLSEAVGAISGFISRSGMERYSESIVQPALSPPMILFPIVWGILYALMGISAARISLAPGSMARSRERISSRSIMEASSAMIQSASSG